MAACCRTSSAPLLRADTEHAEEQGVKGLVDVNRTQHRNTRHAEYVSRWL